jgi:HK97 family phage portal protein
VNLFRRMFAAVTGDAPRPNPDDERLWTPFTGGVVAASGAYVTAESVLQLDAVEACLHALSAPLSTIPIGLFEPAQGDGDEAAEPYNDALRDHALLRLLNRQANRRQTAMEFRAEQFRHLALRRNCYAFIEQNFATGEIDELIPIHPDRVSRVERRDDGSVWYYIIRQGRAGADWFSQDRIWHVRMAPLDVNGLQGRAVYDTQREVFGHAIAVRDYGSRFFANSGQQGGHLEPPPGYQWADKEEPQKFMERWRAARSGRATHADNLLPAGFKYTAVSVENNKAQFIETRVQAALAIARIWNMPPHRIGMLERATNSNIEQQALEFVVYTLLPFVVAFEQSIAKDLLVAEDEQENVVAVMNLSGLLRGDIASRYKAYALGRQWGFLSANDIRRAENMTPLDDDIGDRYLEPGNMREAGEAAEANAQLGAPGAEDGGGEGDPTGDSQTGDGGEPDPASNAQNIRALLGARAPLLRKAS